MFGVQRWKFDVRQELVAPGLARADAGTQPQSPPKAKPNWTKTTTDYADHTDRNLYATTAETPREGTRPTMPCRPGPLTRRCELMPPSVDSERLTPIRAHP